MKILAVSDKENLQLQNSILKNMDVFKNIDAIVSCGDLSKNYLEFLVDSIKKELFFVEGNHPVKKTYGKNCFEKIVSKVYENEPYFDYGGINLHSRIHIYKNYIFVGFEGAMKYNGKSFQYSEKEMSRIVNKVSSAIKKQQFLDFVFRRKKKEIIIISHAPIAQIHDKNDICHQGFECFRKFIEKFNPILWLHGHIHYEGQMNEQISRLNNTLVVNAYGVHLIDISNGKINIKSNAKIFNLTSAD